MRTLVLKEPTETSLDVRLDERPGWEFVNIDHDNDPNVVLSSTFPLRLERVGRTRGLDLIYILIKPDYLAPSTGHGFICEQNKKAACRSDPFVDALLRDRLQVVQIEPANQPEFFLQDIFESNHCVLGSVAVD